MIITPASLDAAYTGFSHSFQQGVQSAAAFWSKLAMQTGSDTEQEVYSFMSRIPRLREWVGERVYNDLAANAYTLPNKDYEDSFEVPRNKFEDDKFGIYNHSAQALGQAVALWPDDIVIEALLAGGSQLCYDGQYFFDTDHPKNPQDASAGTQGNLYTTTALSATNYNTVRSTMRALVGEDGKTMRITPNLLVVPPALEKTAREIVIAQTVPNSGGTASQTNVQAGTADILVIDDLAASAGGSDTTWYLLDSTKPIKPFLFQLRRSPMLQFFDRPTDANVFEKKKFRFGVDCRGRAGYGLWYLAAKCTA